MRNLLFLVSPLAALAACYNPTLPQEPFLCNDTSPSCPSGYTCQPNQAGDMVCIEGDSTFPDGRPDAQAFVCADDSQVETAGKNDTKETAYPTPISPSNQETFKLVGLAICPPGDLDFFSLTVGETQNIQATATVNDGPPVQVTIKNSAGVALAEGMQVNNDPHILQATVPNAAAGVYYVVASSGDTSENNYALDIEVTD
ncbi:MAG TPA: hypothetical protein VGM88_14665 [Kofleriaceae bacterium]|jgi:hypothetical protein